jgi:hypothetical protein
MKKVNNMILGFAVIWMSMMMCVFSASASSVLEVSMDEMLQKSQFVFEGRVTAVKSMENSSKRIHTYITFEILDVIKGEYNDKTITLRFLGGTVGDVTMGISDMRYPQQGEQGIYFVESLERNQINPLYGWSQGHFIIDRDAAGNPRVMTNRKLPVTGIKGGTKDRRTGENRHALSHGAARDVVVGQEGKEDSGLTLDEFKKVLHERRVKADE